MSREELWFNRSMGEKMMKITIVGWILILAAVIAGLIILDASAENPSLAEWLPNIRKSVKKNELPSTEPDTPPE